MFIIKKLFSIIIAATFALSFSVSAKQVFAEGEGVDFDQALLNALFQASQQSGQAVITNKITLDMGKLTQHNVSLATDGFIKSYDVLSTNKIADLYHVKIAATISSLPIVEGSSSTYKPQFDLNQIESLQIKINQQSQFIRQFTGTKQEWLDNLYRISVISSDVSTVTPSEVKGFVNLKIEMDPSISAKFLELLKAFKQKTLATNYQPYGYLKHDPYCKYTCLTTNKSSFYHPSIIEALPKLIKAQVNYGDFSQDIYLYLNTAFYFKKQNPIATYKIPFKAPYFLLSHLDAQPLLKYNDDVFKLYKNSEPDRTFYDTSQCPLYATLDTLESIPFIYYSGNRRIDFGSSYSYFTCALPTLDTSGVFLKVPFQTTRDKLNHPYKPTLTFSAEFPLDPFKQH